MTVVKGTARNPNAFETVDFSIDVDDDWKLTATWGPETSQDNFLKIPEYIFREMAERYLDAHYASYLKYAGVTLEELLSGNANYFYKKQKVKGEEITKRFMEVNHA